MTEALRRALMERGEVDTSRAISDHEGLRLIPVLGPPSTDLAEYGAIYSATLSTPLREIPLTPYEEVLSQLDLPEHRKSQVPRKWEVLGDVLILRLPEELKEHETEVASAFARVLEARTVAADEGGPTGTFREPRLRVIWGDGTETTHVENGVRYRLDAAKIMFSSGNVRERIRMASVCRDGEVVVDMFAGVGHLSLPMAVHSRPARVYACELNPVAYHYLVESVFLNGVEDVVEPLPGDCLETAPESVADRVVMGCLTAGEAHLVKAVEALRRRGTIHYHEACPVELADERPEERVRRAAARAGAEVVSVRRAVVKSYAPGVSHVVLDAEVSR
jgi:tRNA wybutosine-synthesizing protein 2